MPACRTLLRLVLLSSAAVPAVAGAQAPAVEEIVVTGSRIPRPNLTAVQPLQVIQGERLDQRGFINLADALNEEPTMGVPVSPISDQATFGTGRNFVNLNNLGSNRTLVLVNGRRFVGGNPASIFTGAENPRFSDSTGRFATLLKRKVWRCSVSSMTGVLSAPMPSRSSAMSLPSGPMRPIPNGMCSGCFSACPGVGFTCCSRVSVYCFAAAS